MSTRRPPATPEFNPDVEGDDLGSSFHRADLDGDESLNAHEREVHDWYARHRPELLEQLRENWRIINVPGHAAEDVSTTAGRPVAPELTDEQIQILAPITSDDRSVDRAKVDALLKRDPTTFTTDEALAMRAVFFSPEFCEEHGLADLTYTGEWRDALMKVVGGTSVRERVRHGETVERSVTHHRGRADVRRFHVRRELDTGASTPSRSRAARSREHRPGPTRRASSSSTTSSADPGDPDEPEPRVCACGCGQAISHKRAGARTFDAACRKRLSRDGGHAFPDDVREERRLAWSHAAAGGRGDTDAVGHSALTAELTNELREIEADDRLARSRATTPRRTELDDLAVADWLMQTNGVSTRPRLARSPWRQPQGGLRTREAVAA